MVSLFAVIALSVTAGAASADGMTFATDSYFDQEKNISPTGSITAEAEIWLDPTKTTDAHTPEIVFGNYKDNSSAGIDFLVRDGKYIEIYRRIPSGASSVRFDTVNLREFCGSASNPAYCRISLSCDVTSGVLNLYVSGTDANGETKTAFETKTYSNWAQSNTFAQLANPFRVGGDLRDGNTKFFCGKIRNVALYNDVRTETESLAYVNNGFAPDSTDENLLFAYDLTDTSVTGLLTDLSANKNNAINPKTYVEPEPQREYDYSFAVVGDPQYLVRNDTRTGSTSQNLKKLYDWILANVDSKKIAYVMGVGDITDSRDKEPDTASGGFSTSKEWKLSYEQLSRLNGIVPYSLNRGNHDNEYYFDKYFADNVADDDIVNTFYKSQFSDPDYSDNSVCFFDQNSVKTAYTKFVAGTERYLLMMLDDNPTDAMLEWANGVVARNPDYRVIITTHTYLGYTGYHADDTENYEHARHDYYPEKGENLGTEIWEKLVSKHPNIVLALCGHDNKVNKSNLIKKVWIGDNGNEVVEILNCPQNLDGSGDDAHGMVTMLYFSNGGKDVSVEYISTVKTVNSADGEDVYYNPDINHFDFTLAGEAVDSKYGLIAYDYSDAEKYPFAVFDEKYGFIGGFETLGQFNGNNGALQCAKEYLSYQNFWRDGSYGENELSVTILLRRDYTYDDSEAYANLAQIMGRVKIDLDDNTLTLSASKSLFASSVKPWGERLDHRTEIEVLDGKLAVGAKSVITFDFAGDATADLSTKEYIHIFSNVEFIAASTASNLIATYGTDDKTVGTRCNPEVILNNCTYDLGSAPSGIKLFNIGNGTQDARFTVTGGTVKSNAACDFALVAYTGTGGVTKDSMICFTEGTAGYLSVNFPDGTDSLPSAFSSLTLYNESGEILSLASKSGSAYALTPYSGNDYFLFKGASVPKEYESAEDYPFIVLDGNGRFVGAAKNYAKDVAKNNADGSALEIAKDFMGGNVWDSTCGNFKPGSAITTIYLRRDYTLQTLNTVSEEYGNFAQFKGNVTIDLGEYKLSANSETEKSIFFGTLKWWDPQYSNTEGGIFDTEVTVVGGEIVIYNTPLIKFSVSSNGAGKNMTYNFVGTKITVKGSATLISAGSASAAANAGASFTDCTVDFTEAASQDSSIALFHTGNANLTTNINVAGGSIIMGNKSFTLNAATAGAGKLCFAKSSESGYTVISTDKGFTGSDALVNEGKLTFIKKGSGSSYALTPTASIGLSFTPKASVTLDSSLIFNIYLPAHSALVSATVCGENAVLGEAEGGYYALRIPLASNEAFKNITLTVTLDFDGVNVNGTFTFSLIKYASAILNMNASKAEKTLAKDIISYVRSAYVYFNGASDTDADIIAADALLDGYERELVRAEGSADINGALYGVTFVLGATPSVRFILPEGVSTRGYVFTQDGEELEYTVGTTFDGGKSYLHCDISLYAYRMIDSIEYTNGETSGVYHINSYCDSIGGAGANLAKMVAGFYNYCLSAEEYRKSVLDN